MDTDPTAESFADVLEAVAEMQRGEGSPAAASLARLREKLGVQPPPGDLRNSGRPDNDAQ
ncbi:MAG TPA: hypothetical protein VGB24_03655 [Longimicrobium sp.]|jgi:hypothetical protein|uniref:hypothetical protein n=1 Tax=Longimicrobium sp. TaxID=2029185 RepID=UPI002ED93B96